MLLKIDKKQFKDVLRNFKIMETQFNTVTSDRNFLNSVGQLLVSRGKTNLEEGGAGNKSYALLKPATQKQKRRLGYSLKPLQRTGLMKQSLSHEVGSRLNLTGIDIIKHHQFGAPRAGIEQREIYTIEPGDVEDVKEFLIRRLKQLNAEIQ